MFLTKAAIWDEYGKGNIEINPFHEEQLNPNSYDVRLAPIMYVVMNPYSHDGSAEVDMKKPQVVHEQITIPREGVVLKPGIFYLGATYEKAGSNKYVSLLDGKSGVARNGLSIHITAGFGDLGFCGHWTLEITVVAPTRVYPLQKIGQVSFHAVQGAIELYKGNHGAQEQAVPRLSQMHIGMAKDEELRNRLLEEWKKKTGSVNY